jgi:hypothetical protein
MADLEFSTFATDDDIQNGRSIESQEESIFICAHIHMKQYRTIGEHMKMMKRRFKQK